MERVCIFVDGSNLHHGLKKQKKDPTFWIDYHKLFRELLEKRELMQIYYYSAPLDRTHYGEDSYRGQQKFFANLKRNSKLTLKLGRLEKRITSGVTTFVEKGVDVNIAVDMISLAYDNRYDTAILVSGDGDFASAIAAVQKHNKIVEVASTPARKAYHLQQVCNRFVSIDQSMLDKCGRNTTSSTVITTTKLPAE